MRLVVVSHKPCWRESESRSGFATTGGFPFQIEALADLFTETVVVVPVIERPVSGGGIALAARGLRVVALDSPAGADLRRKLALPGWLIGNLRRVAREMRQADLVHIPIPGDIGTIGLLIALWRKQPLFVRYCGNWGVSRTLAERFWHWLMERYAGERRVMMATGGGAHPPSARNPQLTWIFATSLRQAELEGCRQVRSAPRQPPRLITVARQERSKGIDHVLRALAILGQSIAGIALDIVGDGAQRGELERLAAELGVTERVRFHGQLGHHEVVELLRQADLFCLPTRSEGFPKAVHEALASGLPVVTTAVSVLPELIGPDVTGAVAGMLIDPAPTAGELAAAIGHCLADPLRYGQMSATAVARAARYSLEEWSEVIRRRLLEAGIDVATSAHARRPVADQDVTRL